MELRTLLAAADTPLDKASMAAEILWRTALLAPWDDKHVYRWGQWQAVYVLQLKNQHAIRSLRAC